MTVSASLRGTRRPVILQESRAPQAPDVTCGTRTAVHGWGWPDPDALGPLTDCPLAGVGLRMIVEVISLPPSASRGPGSAVPSATGQLPRGRGGATRRAGIPRGRPTDRRPGVPG